MKKIRKTPTLKKNMDYKRKTLFETKETLRFTYNNLIYSTFLRDRAVFLMSKKHDSA